MSKEELIGIVKTLLDLAKYNEYISMEEYYKHLQEEKELNAKNNLKNYEPYFKYLENLGLEQTNKTSLYSRNFKTNISGVQFEVIVYLEKEFHVAFTQYYIRKQVAKLVDVPGKWRMEKKYKDFQCEPKLTCSYEGSTDMEISKLLIEDSLKELKEYSKEKIRYKIKHLKDNK